MIRPALPYWRLIVIMIFLLMFIILAALFIFIIPLCESAFNRCSSVFSCGIVKAKQEV